MALPNNETTHVGIEYVIYGIRGVDTIGSTATLACQLSLRWRDQRLEWDPEAYGGLKHSSLATDPGTNRNYIWTPDIETY